MDKVTIGGDPTRFEGHVTYTHQVSKHLKLIGYNGRDLTVYRKSSSNWKEAKRIVGLA